MQNESRTAQLQKVTAWAEQHPEIRAALLTSSTTNPAATVDRFSDLDIDLIVTDLPVFLSDDSWIGQFGAIITTIKEGVESFDGRCASRMVLYEDYSKIDFLIFSADKFKAENVNGILHEDLDIGYRVLLDKDGLTTHLPPPTYKSFNIQKPTEEKFHWVLNNYWWDLTYVAKCLAREELYYAKFMSEKVVRFEHQQVLIEWYIGMQQNWNITTNKYGRLFKDYLTTADWLKASSTFSGADMAENWTALFAYVEFGKELGQKLAAGLGYSYPEELEKKITGFIHYAYSTVVNS